jgi:1-acyl-sn-glycerol-3-phosphate acyltransferase
MMDSWKLEPAKDLGLPLGARLRSVEREQGLIPYLVHLICSVWVKVILRLYHRMEIIGRENLPKSGPFVLASNHASHLDVAVLASALNWRLRCNAFPIAAGDTFFETPIVAVASAVVINALPMWRKRRGIAHELADLRQRLVGRACIYIVFPEGTRSRTGEMGKFKSGLGMIVAGTPVPVVPCRLEGTFESLPPGKRVPRPRKIRMRIGPSLTFDGIEDKRQGWDEIAGKLEAAVRSL